MLESWHGPEPVRLGWPREVLRMRCWSFLVVTSMMVSFDMTWWINFHQDVLYVEVRLDPSYGPAPDYVPGNPATKAEALRFVRAVASRI
jgi:hypothetical protein